MRYAVESQLLNLKPSPQAVLQDKSIQKLVRRLRDPKVGIPALETGKVTWANTANAYWDLFFLADIGLTAKDMGLDREIDEFFKLQLPDGTFVTEDDHAPNYFCVSGIFLSSVARAGYENDPRIGKYVDFILSTQQADGGWHCGDDHTTGGKYEGTDSCPMNNLNILQLLGLYEEHRNDPRFDGALDLLFEHWLRREENWRPSNFGIGKRFKGLEYPATKYGILRVLDVGSLFPHALKSDGFRDMLDFVIGRAVDGRFVPESIHESYAEFDFGQKEEPSRWITFIVERIKKRQANYT
jgi:hypothetical protein